MSKEITEFHYRGEDIKMAADDQVLTDHFRQYKNFYEHWMLEFIAHHIRRGGVWIDCGANIGNHAIYFAKYCTAAHVIAYEPVKENFELLDENATANKAFTVSAVPGAVGAATGWVTMVKREDQRNSQYTAVEGDQVQVVTIDTEPYDNVGLIKIDVEGMELDVIKGALQTIERDMPELFIEIWNEQTKADILALIEPFGYHEEGCYNPAPTYHFSTKTYPKMY